MIGDRDPLFDASLDISTLANLFRAVNAEAQAMIADGEPALELYALTLEALAEKGIREADAANSRISKAQRKAAKAAAPVPPAADPREGASKH